MTRKQRKRLLEHKPDRPYPAEPQLGAWYTDAEIDATVKAIQDSMDYRVGFGFNVDEIVAFEEAFASYCGTAFAVSLVTASVGLDIAMMCLDLEPGDEVITPALNFKACSLAIIGQGGKPVLCEIDPQTFNADPADIEKRITPKTRAILPVHMNGLSAPIDDYLEIAERHPHPKYGPLKVIGDAARACGGGYKRTKIGKKGWMTVFSFHTMKLMTTLGEGGMITTDDEALATKIRNIRQWGGGEEWGTSYKITKPQAAVGTVQLARLDEMISLRVRRARERQALLKGIPELTLTYEPPECDHTFYLNTLMVSKEWKGKKRDALSTLLLEEYGVGTMVGNPPVWQNHAFISRYIDGQQEDLPVSTETALRLFCVSLHPLMTEQENAYIAAALWDAVDRVRD
ncbi:DegT/DnrJ/EryC1/StrS family aminotransferase [bacterium]|nr:DegT/DnrJ/EryC1/StrS aminotransferase [Gemmatimonadota bacterium]MCH2664226.1 DegT/DnrJ/EryC1/StrS family aminotransferase [bacterium]